MKALSLILLLSVVSHKALAETDAKVAEPKVTEPKVTHTKAVDTKVTDAKATDTKIYVVSAQGTLLETEAGKKASQEVEALHKKSQEELMKEQQNLAKEAETLKVTATTMSKESYNKKALELQSKEEDLKNKAKRVSGEVQLFAQSKMEELGKYFEQAVQDVAEQKGADFIFDETGRLVYANPKYNITKDVTVAMNNNQKAMQVASAKKDAAPVKKAA